MVLEWNGFIYKSPISNPRTRWYDDVMFVNDMKN